MIETKKWEENNFEYEQAFLFAKRGTCELQFWEVLLFPRPQIQHTEGKNVFKDSKKTAQKNYNDTKTLKKAENLKNE